MEIKNLANGLLDSLETFDNEILPLGLYASDDLIKGKRLKPRYQEWHGTIFPYLKSQGFITGGFYPVKTCISKGYSHLLEGGFVEVILVKFSNVKVLKAVTIWRTTRRYPRFVTH